jgi:hypothetical protein
VNFGFGFNLWLACYLIIRFRIRMPEIRDRIRMLIAIMPIEEMMASKTPIPVIMESAEKRTSRAETICTPSA